MARRAVNLHGCASKQGPQAMRGGGPRAGVWSERGVSPQRGVRTGERNRSERAKVASVGEGTSPASQGPWSRIAHSKDEGCGCAGIPA
jgi:hypothetical protein